MDSFAQVHTMHHMHCKLAKPYACTTLISEQSSELPHHNALKDYQLEIIDVNLEACEGRYGHLNYLNYLNISKCSGLQLLFLKLIDQGQSDGCI